MGDQGHVRWWGRQPRWLVVLVLAVLVLAPWLGLDRASNRSPVQGSSPMPAQRPVAMTPVSVSPAAFAPTASTTPGPTARPAPHVAALGPGQVEICGFGSVTLQPDDPYGLRRVPPAVRQAAIEQADALMLASADEQVRAAALLIGARARQDGAHERIDRLAWLAAGSRDPLVYAMALEGCKGWGSAEAGACRLLSLAQWVRLDPDNALPWLELAAEAQRRHDADAESEAMHRAALAHRSDARSGLLPSLVERALGEHAAPLQRTLALSASWGVQASWVPSHAAQAFAYCSADALADPNRRHPCERLADTLARRGNSLVDLGAGLVIGTALGWPAERLRALQREQDAIHEAGASPPDGLDFSCDGVERTQAWMRQLAARGELQALRDGLARSGRSIDELSERHRQNFSVAAAAAASAAQPAEAH